MMYRCMLILFTCFLVFVIAIQEASAQANAAESSSKKEGKRTAINFEDQLIEGQATKPELFYLLQRKQFNYKRLIRLREDFLPEMRKTAEDIHRKGSAE